MSSFSQGNMFNVAGAVGTKLKQKAKQATKHFLKKLLKKFAKYAFKLLLKMLAKAAVALVTAFGIPVFIAFCVMLIVGGALVYVRWISGDDEANIQKVTAAYNAAIEKTTALAEYRPPLLVVQAIDNMRITTQGKDVDDIDPVTIANALKPDLIYKDFTNTVKTSTTYYTQLGTFTNSSETHTTQRLLVEAHTWNRMENISYTQNAHTTSETYPIGNIGVAVVQVTTIEWVRDPSACSIQSIGSSPSTDSSAPALLTGVGSKTHPYFAKYAPRAIEESRKSGIPASVTLAQAVQEGGWGTSELTFKYFNFFGIRAQKGDGWTGPTVMMWTKEFFNGAWTEIKAPFRAYGSAAEGFADHSGFLLENGRYQTALSKKNPYEFANELQAAGYATDPNYARYLKNIIYDYNLLQYDLNGGIDPDTGKPFEDVGYVPGSGAGGVLVGCGTPDFSKFDAILHKYNFTADDVELIAEAIKENDASHIMLAGYNGDFGATLGDTPVVGSDDGTYVEMPPVQPGQMVWPTTARYVTSPFGMRVNPTNGVYKLHKGIDIAPANTDNRDFPNIASMDGLVIESGMTSDGYGYKVVIDHGGGVQTLYAHMKAGSLKVSVGQQVKAGTVLGIMGSTGDVIARHLHFEVHLNGKPTNPLGYLHREAE